MKRPLERMTVNDVFLFCPPPDFQGIEYLSLDDGCADPSSKKQLEK
jgi:hypothetical protein